MSKQPKSNGSAAKALILFGLDETGKPRAAKFTADQRDLVVKAAGLMKLEVYELQAEAMKHKAIGKVQTGRLYSNGHGFVPHIRRDHYSKLLIALGRSDAETECARSLGIEFNGYPNDWNSIAQGHLILAQCDDVEDGWCEALVVKVDKDSLTVKWRDYPSYEPFSRHRNAVALLNPIISQKA